jgi:hypothetical protein
MKHKGLSRTAKALACCGQFESLVRTSLLGIALVAGLCMMGHGNVRGGDLVIGIVGYLVGKKPANAAPTRRAK